MTTRRDWLRKGAQVTIGGALVTVGATNKAQAAPAAEPLNMDGCFIFRVETGDTGHITAELHFATDGSFRVAPRWIEYGDAYASKEYVYGEPIASGPNATARDLIEALAAAASR